MVFFEAPHRLGAVLVDAAELLGATRRGAVCRELTKTYEEVKRGPLHELAAWAADGVLGEITLVVEGADGSPVELSDEDLQKLVASIEGEGRSRKDAIVEVAARTGQPKRRVYNAAHGASGSAP
jgi:16S rRNA (cytidine1402-2'-O)-methyltransferase